MKAGELKAGQEFKIVGWDEETVFTLIIPAQDPENFSIKVIKHIGLGNENFFVLAADIIDDKRGAYTPTPNYFAFPISREVILVKKINKSYRRKSKQKKGYPYKKRRA